MTATYTHLVDLRRELERTQQAMAKAKETFDAEAPEPGTQKHALDTVTYDILMNLQQYFAEHYRRALTAYVTDHNFLLPPESQEPYVLPSTTARALRETVLHPERDKHVLVEGGMPSHTDMIEQPQVGDMGLVSWIVPREEAREDWVA